MAPVNPRRAPNIFRSKINIRFKKLHYFANTILVTVFLFNFLFRPLISHAVYSWAETQPAGAVDKSWTTAASDSDGSNLVVGVNSGRLYTTSNFGATWTERQPAGDLNKFWQGAASDADGSNLIVGGSSGRLYTSSDAGVTWTERQPAGAVNKNWFGVASDSDGSNLMAGAYPGRLYTSSDSGVTWTERQPAGAVDKSWYEVASDSDGSNLFVGGYPGRLYTSSDSGVTWTERQPAGAADLNWPTLDSDDDGSNLIAGVYGGRLYTSSDSGVTWTERQPAGAADKTWYVSASDSVGLNLTVGAYAGRLYTSSDSGVTWAETQPAGDVTKIWGDIDSDSDGSNLIASVGNTGRIYVTADTVAPTVSTLSPADNATSISATANLVLTFSEIVDAEAGAANDIIIKKTSDNSTVETIDAQDAKVTGSGTTIITINPANDLVSSTAYYIQIGADAFDDASSNSYAGISDTTSWSFTISDTTAPTVSTLSPADDATGVSPTANLVITFSENITAVAAKNIYIKKTSDNSTVETIVANGGLVGIASAIATINPSTTLSDLTGYYIQIDSGAFIDASSNAYTGIADTTTFNFTTGDTANPTVLTYSPLDNATGVTITANLVLTFSEIVDAETGNIVIKKSSDNSIFETIGVTSSNVTGSGTAAITMNPTANFAYETEYYVTIDATAFDDVASNSYAGISEAATWSFTTEVTPTCPQIANAATYNAYPTCGVATCSGSNYTVTNGVCVASSSGGSAWVPSPGGIGNGSMNIDIPMHQTRDIGVITDRGVNILLYIGSQANLKILLKTHIEQDYQLKITDVDLLNNIIRFTIASISRDFTLKMGETINIDLDRDGVKDIEIKFTNVWVNRIELTVKSLLVSKENKAEREASLRSGQFSFSAGEVCPSSLFNRKLKRGMAGDDVKVLKQYLNNNNFLLTNSGPGSKGKENNYFGVLTEKALIKFQKSNNIQATLGTLDLPTRTFLGCIKKKKVRKS